DLRVVGGEQLVDRAFDVERAAAWGGGLVDAGVAFAGIVPCVVGGRRRNRLGLTLDRLLLLVLWLLLRRRNGLTAFADHARARRCKLRLIGRRQNACSGNADDRRQNHSAGKAAKLNATHYKHSTNNESRTRLRRAMSGHYYDAGRAALRSVLRINWV